MQKVAKSILTGIIFTFVSACGATLNTGIIDYTKKELPLELKEIEKEFSVKAVSQSYVHSRMSTFISTSGTRLTK